MITEVDICNIALTYLGDAATVSSIHPSEGSVQADHCARFYPISLREILERYPWSFATIRAEIPRLAISGGDYLYPYPSDCVRFVQLVNGAGQLIESRIERRGAERVIVSRAEASHIVYVSSETPANMFPALFAEALAHLLASKLAGAMMAGSTGREASMAQREMYERMLRQAIQINAFEDTEYEVQGPSKYTGDYMGDFYAYR